MPESLALIAFLEASVRLGVPLALAAIGETITERSGVINIGLEGSIISGALGGALGALWLGGAWGGLVVGALAGLFVALVFAAFAIGLGTDQIITGTAITLGGLGFTGAIYQAEFGATGPGKFAGTVKGEIGIGAAKRGEKFDHRARRGRGRRIGCGWGVYWIC